MPGRTLRRSSTTVTGACSAPATAVICDGAETREISLTVFDQRFTHIYTHGDGIVLAAARCARVDIDVERYQEPIPEDELHLTKSVRVIDEGGHTLSAFYATTAATPGWRRPTPRTPSGTTATR
ncbi:hypothetical protein GCM10023334_100860 [Nonomuraea thailandensis]